MNAGRLLVSFPPRHGKSHLISRWTPPWFLGNWPNKNVILATHTAEFAEEWGRGDRDILDEFGDRIGISLKGDSKAANRWNTTQGGGMVATGVGGVLVGRGAHLLLVDDPIKDDEQATSVVMRNKIWNWWRGTAYNRLEPGAAVIVVMTRWHEDDLVGRLLKDQLAGGEQWRYIRLPALCEQPADPVEQRLGRALGDPLWPARFDKDALLRIKRGSGSYFWNALYQQRPAPLEGGIFNRKWWKWYSVRPAKFDEIIQSWDMAFKESEDSSFVVGQVWGKIGANKYLLDQIRARMEFTTTLQAVRNLSAKWPEARLKLVEDKANGPAVISTLRSQIAGLVAVKPQGSKEARAQAVSPQVEAGNVFLPAPEIAPWISDYVEELSGFPNALNDDQVDATSQALFRLGGRFNREVRM